MTGQGFPAPDNDRNKGMSKSASQSGQTQTGRDIVTLGIACAAIVLFIGTGGRVLPQAVAAIFGSGPEPDPLLVNALILNIALVIFGWRRYRELCEEMKVRKRAETEARKLADTDPLTGCLNRRAVQQAADALLERLHAAGEAAVVFMIDLDNFKQVNDYNGHGAGDAILVESARRIRAIMPEDSLIARIGGDEFACVMRLDPGQHGTASKKAENLIEAFSHPMDAKGTPVGTTLSLGIARSDMPAEPGRHAPRDAQALLHMADIAMYQAKKQGRNRYFWFEQSMESELRFRSEVEGGIRRGIPAGEFVPYYEQQIDLASGRLAGFEVLARWNSPTLGMVSPEVFIPVAEEIGVIGDLSESVVRQALLDGRDWDQELTLSINVSPLQLRDPWFAQKLLKILVETNFPPSRLEVEITESCLHENVGLVRTLITSLKNQGIAISLDDFGTGYSSLSQLRTLPFDRIKIDRSFVTNLIENQDSATIVQAITSLGDGLGMPITAEGIESEEVLARLREFGDFKGQGYLYGRPQSAESTRKLLATKGLLGLIEAPAPLPETVETEQRRKA